MEEDKPDEYKQLRLLKKLAGNIDLNHSAAGKIEVAVEGSSKEKVEKRKVEIQEGAQSAKRGKYHTGSKKSSSSRKSSDSKAEDSDSECDNCDRARRRYLYMRSKAREMNMYSCQLNQKMQELVQTHVKLATLLLTLLESVDIPGSPKLQDSVLHLGEGKTKKAILDRINVLLERAGLASFPGALGEILYNDLFMELRNSKK